MSLIEVFIDRLYEVEGPLDTPCWCYQGHRIGIGYGQMRYKGKQYVTHRLAYDLWVGDIPLNTYVLHKCDKPSCCNPDHLFLGNQQKNMDDMVNKGRHVPCPGSKNGMSVLNEQSVKDIREARDQGVSRSELAKKYNVNKVTIRDVELGRTWRHI